MHVFCILYYVFSVFKVLSKFELTHEEIVERRKLQSEKSSERQKSVSVDLHDCMGSRCINVKS